MANYTNTTDIDSAFDIVSILVSSKTSSDISPEIRALVDIVVGCVVTQIVLILGIPGNVLNVIVFVTQGLRDRVALLLFSLTLSDLLNLASYSFIKGSCYIQRADPVGGNNWKTTLYPNVLQLNLFAITLSNSFVALLSLDRCVSITFPFQSRQKVKFKHTLCAILLLVLFYTSFYLPTLFIYKVSWTFDVKVNATVAQMVPNDVFFRHPGILTARDTMHWTVAPLLLVLVVSSSLVTLGKLREATRARKNMTDTKMDAAERKITKMVLFVAMVMTCCVLPDLVVFCVHVTEPEFYLARKYHNAFVISQYFIFLASCINSSANFYLYMLMSSKFRGTLKALFGCENLLRNKHSPTRTEMSTLNTENIADVDSPGTCKK